MPKTVEHIHWPQLLATRKRKQGIAGRSKTNHICI
jgi:hypothetical protein